MLDKPLAILRIWARAATERLGVPGITLADEERYAAYERAGGIEAILNDPRGVDAALKAAGV